MKETNNILCSCGKKVTVKVGDLVTGKSITCQKCGNLLISKGMAVCGMTTWKRKAQKQEQTKKAAI